MTFASRLYADLIYKAESKFANWDPSRPIEAGDFGTIDRKTGLFQKSGNIYEDKVVDGIKEEYGLVQDCPIEYMVVHSCSAREHGSHADISAGLNNLASASLSLQFEFSNSRGALLVMAKPRTTRVPDQFLRISTQINCLKGKILVMAAVTCPGYVRYLSAKKSETLGVALMATLPVPAAPGLSAGGALGLKWIINGVSGNLQQSYHDKELYTPLFYAKTIRPSGRLSIRRLKRGSFDSEDPENYCWEDAEMPWGPLDEQGREVTEQYETYEDSESEHD